MISKKDLVERLIGRKLGSKRIDPKKQISIDGIPYVDIMNPKTGRRYVIPTLHITDRSYFRKYANFMYIKERDPDLFQKIIGWD